MIPGLAKKMFIFGQIDDKVVLKKTAVQIINNDWDGHALSYDLAILFTGKMNFADGDGYAYIGGICQQ